MSHWDFISPVNLWNYPLVKIDTDENAHRYNRQFFPPIKTIGVSPTKEDLFKNLYRNRVIGL